MKKIRKKKNEKFITFPKACKYSIDYGIELFLSSNSFFVVKIPLLS